MQSPDWLPLGLVSDLVNHKLWEDVILSLVRYDGITNFQCWVLYQGQDVCYVVLTRILASFTPQITSQNCAVGYICQIDKWEVVWCVHHPDHLPSTCNALFTFYRIIARWIISVDFYDVLSIAGFFGGQLSLFTFLRIIVRQPQGLCAKYVAGCQSSDLTIAVPFP